MGKIYESITPELRSWIGQQHIFFVATAPLSKDGHVNVSPKGLDCLRITGPTQVAYMDVTGSGAETIAHLRENGRIVLMFCGFSGAPKIVRLHGTGKVTSRTAEQWSNWKDKFPSMTAERSVIVVAIKRVSDSCGYGVPKMDFVEDRDAMSRWAATKGEKLRAYRLEKNTKSIDGLDALNPRDA